MAETLPEGTDHSVDSGADTSADRGSGAPREQLANEAADLKGRAQAKAEELRGQAGDKARDYAEQGKDRATGALDEVARLISDNATQLDDKLGATYGDYARRAADYVSEVADILREKDVEELLDDTRTLIRRSPGLAIGAGATVGFALARIIKAGSDGLEESARGYGVAASVKSSGRNSTAAGKN